MLLEIMDKIAHLLFWTDLYVWFCSKELIKNSSDLGYCYNTLMSIGKHEIEFLNVYCLLQEVSLNFVYANKETKFIVIVM